MVGCHCHLSRPEGSFDDARQIDRVQKAGELLYLSCGGLVKPCFGLPRGSASKEVRRRASGEVEHGSLVAKGVKGEGCRHSFNDTPTDNVKDPECFAGISAPCSL